MVSSTSIHTVFARRLKAARLQAGLSQGALGIAAGIDESVAAVRINRYEQAVHFSDFATATNIARALNIPAAYFYCEGDDLALLVLEFHRADPIHRKAVMESFSISK